MAKTISRKATSRQRSIRPLFSMWLHVSPYPVASTRNPNLEADSYSPGVRQKSDLHPNKSLERGFAASVK